MRERRIPTISAVLPAYNEARVIVDVVRRTAAALSDNSVPEFEIVVVDDGSRDDTGGLVEALSGEDERVRLVRHPRNRGYGAALRSGFEAARRQAVWLLDSDGQFDPRDLPLLLPHYSPHTVVAGFRRKRTDSLVRRLNNRAFFALVRLRWGRLAKDVNCGFKLFPAPVGKGLRTSGAMISTELLLRARQAGYEIVDVPVPHHPRLHGTPTGSHPRVVLRAFRELARMARDPEALAGLEPPPA